MSQLSISRPSSWSRCTTLGSVRPARQSIRAPSWLHEASTDPSGENARELIGALCPFKVSSSRPVSTSQIRIALPSPAAATSRPSGVNARQRGLPESPWIVREISPVSGFQSLISPVSLTEARSDPSGA